MTTSYLPHRALSSIYHAPDKKVLPEHCNAAAQWWEIWLYHAERAVYRPKCKKHNKEVVRVPEALKVAAAVSAHGRDYHCYQGDEHHPSRPAGASGNVDQDKPLETQSLFRSELGKVVHVGDCVDQREDENGPAHD